MAEIFKGRPADLLIARGSMARFQTAPGEAPSYAGHVGGLLSPGLVLHAKWLVKTESLGKWDTGHQYKVYRKRGVPMSQRRSVARWTADQYSAKLYPAWRLLNQFGDYLLAWARWGLSRGRLTGEVYFFRKLLKDPTWGLCHRIWAQAYYEVLGYDFGRPPWEANPDQMLDWVEAHPEVWEKVYEKV